MNSGQIIGQTLQLYDIDHIFALSGGDHPLLMGIRDAGIKYVLAHSERSAVAMADGFARFTGEPSFAYGQWGPGAALAVSGVADAYWGQSPVFCLTSSIHSGGLYRYAYQGIDDQKTMFAPVTKWNALLPNLSRLPDMLRTGIRMAVGGVPGPVHLDIPQELSRSMEQDLPHVKLYAEQEFKKVPAFRVAPTSADIDKITAAIAQSKRPLILAGGGVVASEAWRDLVQFAEKLSIPVITSSAGKSSITTDHPLSVGTIGNYSRKVANEVAGKCDLAIVIGSNLGDHTTWSRKAPGTATKVVHVDIDPGVMGTNYREAVSVLGDAKLVLQALIEAAGQLNKSAWAGWTKEVQSAVAAWKQKFEEKARQPGKDGAVNPYHVMAELNRIIGPDDVIVTDTGYMAAFGNTLVDVKSAGRNYIRASGSLGWGLPAAIGVQCAVKNKGRVICITGDGGIGYHSSDIETAVRYGLPVVTIVMNNSCLAFTYHQLKIAYKQSVPDATNFGDIDYAAVAKAFGAYGERITKGAGVETGIRKALDSGKTAVVDIAVDRDVYAPVIFYEQYEARDV